MLNFLPDFFNKELKIFINIYWVTLLEYAFIIIFFSLNFRDKHRKHFIAYLITFIISLFLFCLLLAYIRYGFLLLDQLLIGKVITELLVYGYIYLSLFMLFKITATQYSIMFMIIICLKMISGHIFSIILNFCGIDDRFTISFFYYTNFNSTALDFMIYYVLHFAFVQIIFWLFGFQKTIEFDKEMKLKILLLGIFTPVFISILFTFANEYAYINDLFLFITIKLLVLFALFLILFIIKEFSLENQSILDKNMFKNLFTKEKKQFEDNKDLIESINMKMHDLKHNIARIESKLTDEELRDFKAAMEIYESSIKYGNETVDLVFHQKELIAKKLKINLTATINGSSLDFIPNEKLYSLLTNALDNCIDAVRDLPEEKRQITVTQKQGCNKEFTIVFANYTSNPSLPSLSTKDRKSIHGFGIKSMKIIMEEYGGYLNYEIADGIFYLYLNFKPNS